MKTTPQESAIKWTSFLLLAFFTYCVICVCTGCQKSNISPSSSGSGIIPNQGIQVKAHLKTWIKYGDPVLVACNSGTNIRFQTTSPDTVILFTIQSPQVEPSQWEMSAIDNVNDISDSVQLTIYFNGVLKQQQNGTGYVFVNFQY